MARFEPQTSWSSDVYLTIDLGLVISCYRRKTACYGLRLGFKSIVDDKKVTIISVRYNYYGNLPWLLYAI